MVLLFVMMVILTAMTAMIARLVSTPAHAGSGCSQYKYEDLRASLYRMYKEVPRGRGLSGPAVIELFQSENGTFTIITVGPLGTCIVMSGDFWSNIEPEVKGKEL